MLLDRCVKYSPSLFSLFQGLSMKTYRRVYFSLCLFLAISGILRTQWKLNPRKKIPDIRYYLPSPGDMWYILRRPQSCVPKEICHMWTHSLLNYLPSPVDMWYILTRPQSCVPKEICHMWTHSQQDDTGRRLILYHLQGNTTMWGSAGKLSYL